MPMPPPESCPELRDTRRTPLARPPRWPMLQPTNSVLPPTRSRQRGLLLQRARAIVLVGGSAAGSVSVYRWRFAISSWMTSGCATGSVGRCSIASGLPPDHCPTNALTSHGKASRARSSADRRARSGGSAHQPAQERKRLASIFEVITLDDTGELDGTPRKS